MGRGLGRGFGGVFCVLRGRVERGERRVEERKCGFGCWFLFRGAEVEGQRARRRKEKKRF